MDFSYLLYHYHPNQRFFLFTLWSKKNKFFYLNKKVVGFFKEFKGELSTGRSAWCHSLHTECCLCHLILTFPLPCFLLSSGFRSTTFWEDDRKREQANSLLQSQYTHQFQQLHFLFCFVLQWFCLILSRTLRGSGEVWCLFSNSIRKCCKLCWFWKPYPQLARKQFCLLLLKKKIEIKKPLITTAKRI